jgi:hypothetical protein
LPGAPTCSRLRPNNSEQSSNLNAAPDRSPARDQVRAGACYPRAHEGPIGIWRSFRPISPGQLVQAGRRLIVRRGLPARIFRQFVTVVPLGLANPFRMAVGKNHVPSVLAMTVVWVGIILSRPALRGMRLHHIHDDKGLTGTNNCPGEYALFVYILISK